jgi:cysteine desulfurase/selenocysteine lyase
VIARANQWAAAARPAPSAAQPSQLDIERVRRDFPALAQRIHNHPLVYLDNAATTQKPSVVLDRLQASYREECANIHRGVYQLSERATAAHEAARDKARRFLGAAKASEIVFVRGATEGINLVAQSWGRAQVQAGDEIVITALEHHSNIVPWQMLAAERGAELRVAPMNDQGDVILDELDKLVGPRTKIVAFTAVSNAIGTVNPTATMVEIAHRHGALALVDAAQAVPHAALDVRALDCYFLVFSGHKLYGPTGIGVLYGKEHLLADMPPWQGGGDMILSVTFEKTTYAPAPAKFEAGTPHIQGAIGLGAAIDYVESLGMAAIARYEAEILAYAEAALARAPGVRLIGRPKHRAAAISFMLDGIHPHDVGTILDRYGIAIRAGHHCAQPTMRRMGVPGTARVSLAFYNQREEIDYLVSCLGEARRVFRA